MVIIKAPKAGLKVESVYPNFKYKSDEDGLIDVEEEHVEKILRNSDFKKSDEKQKAKKEVKEAPKGKSFKELKKAGDE